MFTAIRAWWHRLWQGEQNAVQPTQPQTLLSVDAQAQAFEAEAAVSASLSEALPYDEGLLDKAKTQWQRGDWDGLVLLQRDVLEQHPDRAKLALLVAAGHAQKGQNDEARQFTKLAQDWGCSKKLVAQILISGAQHSLGLALLAAGQNERAEGRLEQALALGTPDGDVKLFSHVRAFPQLHKIQLLAVDGLPPLKNATEKTKP